MKESVCVHHYYITFVCRRKYTRAYNSSSTNTLEYIYRSKTQVHIKVTQKVKRLKGQFWHNRASNAQLGMKILQNQIIGTQTSFCISFGDKLSFILSFLFLERLHCCYIYFHCSYLYNYYSSSGSICTSTKRKFIYFQKMNSFKFFEIIIIFIIYNNIVIWVTKLFRV